MKCIFFLAVMFSAHSFAGDWVLSRTEDPMGDGVNETAFVRSTNTFELNAPYSGVQRATFALRRHHNQDDEFLILIENGQFVCGVSGCFVLARIDDGKSFYLEVEKPADGSSSSLIGTLDVEKKRLILSGKTLLIKATIYQNGNEVFHFDIENTPFAGRKNYSLNELRNMRASGSMPDVTGLLKEKPLDVNDFSICKEVLSDTIKKPDNISIVQESTNKSFFVKMYYEYGLIVAECKRNSNLVFKYYEYL